METMLFPLRLYVEDPGRNGVAIQTNQEIKEGRLVTDDDGFLMMLLERGSLLEK